MREKNRKEIERRLYSYGNRFAIRIFRFANSGNHLHILLKSADKTNLQNFLRTFAGVIPRVVAGAKKGNPYGRFWDSLAYSKLLSFGRQFKNTSNYIAKNTLEAFGIIPTRDGRYGEPLGLKIDYESILDGL